MESLLSSRCHHISQPVVGSLSTWNCWRRTIVRSFEAAGSSITLPMSPRVRAFHQVIRGLCQTTFGPSASTFNIPSCHTARTGELKARLAFRPPHGIAPHPVPAAVRGRRIDLSRWRHGFESRWGCSTISLVGGAISVHAYGRHHRCHNFFHNFRSPGASHGFPKGRRLPRGRHP